MVIRRATKADAEIITEHLFLAMDEILYAFIGMKDKKKAKTFLHYFVEKENNQYSYKNCLVAESEKEVIGSLNIYDGQQLESLREPIIAYIKTHFGIDFNHEEETQEGEYYIDCLGVSEKHRGKGVGTALLKFIIEKYDQKTVGLLVEEGNPNAEKLYLKLGFELVGRKVLAGKKMKHLQLKPKVKE
ncbi:GNAT family N-acetyltransferase [Cyclobacterium qasimii]|uniref:GCN5-related N-acetyltransferase n=2 Tax=Cyclobacterium qasimii TaxID=1350429 RepID=S7VP58_9BACT|nr:GNAT family N-acetyltransferase [Cyclobacterium qasimii]EPR71147.1 GCN5-related N-acetyltransferase [Cyclobacterium qasimii M12-11B]GEO20674.1 N-acetyltransferase [Cyclobacterium qasimii]